MYAGDPASSVFLTRPINRDVASRASFELARQWLGECAGHGPEEHQLCPKAEDVTFTPSRLLETRRDGDRFFVRLRQILPDKKLRYCCLSYCWGGDQPLKTTKETIESRMNGIPFHDLPKTLQNAIIVAQNLKVPMIWIDCLCIVQNDKDDLVAELAKMPEIYKNAFVTISASSASSCYEGFLDIRSPPTDIECEDITLQYKFPDGAIGNIYLSQSQNSTQQDPINARAWTLQESLISPRLLEYGSQQLRWKCKSRRYFDGGQAPQIIKHQDAAENSFLPVTKTSDPDVYKKLVKRTVSHEWPEIVDNYTQRSLSFPGDKPVAIAAMASEIGQPLKLTYLSGLWREYLPEQLLWRMWGDPIRRPEHYRAPSWSWASVEGWVMLERTSNAEGVAIDIIACETEPVSAAVPYGAVNSGSLTIKGRVITGRWFRNRDSSIVLEGIRSSSPNAKAGADKTSVDKMEIDSEEGETSSEDLCSSSSWETATDDDVEDEMLEAVEIIPDAIETDWNEDDLNASIEVQFLQVLAQTGTEGSSGLIIVPATPGNPDSFRRLGYFFFDNRKKDIFGNIDEKTVIII